MALELIKLVKGSSAVAQVGSLGFFKLSAETGGGSGDLISFADATPEQISAISAEISANGMTNEQVASTYGWNIGDTTSITLTTGEVIEVRIIGFNHDDKSDGSGKAGITLQMTHCLATAYPMHSAAKYTWWQYCTMFTSTLPTIKNTFPSDWKSIIKTVNKKQVYTQYGDPDISKNDLFLLAEAELYGRQVSPPTSTGTKDGTQYSYWAQEGVSQLMYRDVDGDGKPETASIWWLRSMYYASSNAKGFCNISDSGYNNYTTYTQNPYGVSFAFCV